MTHCLKEYFDSHSTENLPDVKDIEPEDLLQVSTNDGVVPVFFPFLEQLELVTEIKSSSKLRKLKFL